MPYAGTHLGVKEIPLGQFAALDEVGSESPLEDREAQIAPRLACEGGENRFEIPPPQAAPADRNKAGKKASVARLAKVTGNGLRPLEQPAVELVHITRHLTDYVD